LQSLDNQFEMVVITCFYTGVVHRRCSLGTIEGNP
jgi:hypothetical protein